MGLLNKSTYWKGEPIRGHFVITVEEEDPSLPTIDILNAGLEMIVKANKTDSDASALMILTNTNGLEILQNTALNYEVIYRIPGSVTATLQPLKANDTTRDIYYEINITIVGDEALGSDVLESGTIKIRLDRVKEIPTP